MFCSASRPVTAQVSVCSVVSNVCDFLNGCVGPYSCGRAGVDLHLFFPMSVQVSVKGLVSACAILR